MRTQRFLICIITWPLKELNWKSWSTSVSGWWTKKNFTIWTWLSTTILSWARGKCSNRWPNTSWMYIEWWFLLNEVSFYLLFLLRVYLCDTSRYKFGWWSIIVITICSIMNWRKWTRVPLTLTYCYFPLF